MWYFIIKQDDLNPAQFEQLQKKAALTEIEVFNDPYPNLYIFSVEGYSAFVDTLDLAGITYSVASERPEREELRIEGLRD